MENSSWKKIPNFDNYEVSNNGNIRNKKQNKILKGSYDKCGYLRTILVNNDGNKKNIQFHKIVSQLFLENNFNYKYTKHIDGNKSNNNYKNLKWVKQLSYETKNYKEIYDEIWQIFTENTLYDISNKGRIRNNITNKCLTNQVSFEGYNKVMLNKRYYFVHRLVAQVFIPNPENKETVDHIDRNKNNNVDNLRWATKVEQCENKSKQKIKITKIHKK